MIAPYEQRLGQHGSITADQLRDQAAFLGVATARTVIILVGRPYAELAGREWP